MKDVATEAEYDQTIAEINCLLRKGEANLSPGEDRLLDLLSTLVGTENAIQELQAGISQHR